MKKGVKFVKMSRIPREKGVILNFWNGHVLRLQIQTGHTGLTIGFSLVFKVANKYCSVHNVNNI